MKEKAIKLRLEGFGYRSISRQLGVPWGTVRNWVRHINADKAFDKSLPYRRRLKNDLDLAKTNPTRRKILIRIHGHKCFVCQNNVWNNLPIPLEIDHISGNKSDNTESNLRLICPNCHAQTETYKGKNINTKSV